MNPKEALHHYTVFVGDNGGTITLMGASDIADLKARRLIEPDAVKLWDIFAASPEEAQAIHCMRMGWHPYNPMGETKQCSKGCGAHYYPEGSGICPVCGLV